VTIVTLLCLFVAAPVAHAQSPEPDDARARELFLRGDAHYAAGRYEQAVSDFLEAYELSGKPALLYNLANVYERLSDYAAAADYLRRYLESPEVHDVVSVRERLRRLELAASRPPPVVPANPGPTESASSSRPSWPGWVLGTATVGAAASSVTLGLLTLQSRSDVQSRCSQTQGLTLCRGEASSLLDQERRRALATDISIGTTAVLGAATLAWIATGSGRDARPVSTSRGSSGRGPTVAVAPAVGAGRAGVQLTFTGIR